MLALVVDNFFKIEFGYKHSSMIVDIVSMGSASRLSCICYSILCVIMKRGVTTLASNATSWKLVVNVFVVLVMFRPLTSMLFITLTFI